ncbi:hypothetical protein SAMN06893096_103245 [Geodermatophilus pulveris]|uniref:Uncharacterized protein n=1 Tax=Geodermatophilus pulveris TaxID=1564159 RepID=A0A239DKM2_9ACTN|nr:hypothetical protein [Geodermatophilus pulveris]SNS32967.1 hypothetical protein SAMN06893096_103245 [Geodermatophilus pulveris]
MPKHATFDDDAIRKAVESRRALFAGDYGRRSLTQTVRRGTAETRAAVCAEVEVEGGSIVVDLPWPLPDVAIPLPIPLPDATLVRVCFDIIWDGWWPDGACIRVYFGGEQIVSECFYF